MGEDNGRVTIRIGTTLPLSGNNTLTISQDHRLPPMGIQVDIAIVFATVELITWLDNTKGLTERIRRNIIAGIFLEDDKVTAYLSTGFITEHTVRQTVSTDKTGILHQLLTDNIIGRRVHETTGGDKSNKASLTNAVEGFHKEIVMKSASSGTTNLAVIKGWVKDLDDTKRNIAGCKVVTTQNFCWDGLKASHDNIVIGMQGFQYLTSQQILFKG